MTLQEARKVIGLNIHNLNGSMQMAVATIMDVVEDMLKDAAMVEGNVLELGETYKDLTISVEGKELNEALQPLGVEDGDKVKIIIVPENKEDRWQSARRAAKTLGKMNLGIKFFGNLFPYLRKRGKLDGYCKLSHWGKTPVWLYDTEGIAELINEGKLDYKPKD